MRETTQRVFDVSHRYAGETGSDLRTRIFRAQDARKQTSLTQDVKPSSACSAPAVPRHSHPGDGGSRRLLNGGGTAPVRPYQDTPPEARESCGPLGVSLSRQPLPIRTDSGARRGTPETTHKKGVRYWIPTFPRQLLFPSAVS